MKIKSTAINPRESLGKYRSVLGENFDRFVDAYVEWSAAYRENMFSKENLHTLCSNPALRTMKQINQALKDAGNSDGLNTFFIEMINGQFTHLVIPYMIIEDALPEQYANGHIGLLGSVPEIFDYIHQHEGEL